MRDTWVWGYNKCSGERNWDHANCLQCKQSPDFRAVGELLEQRAELTELEWIVSIIRGLEMNQVRTRRDGKKSREWITLSTLLKISRIKGFRVWYKGGGGALGSPILPPPSKSFTPPPQEPGHVWDNYVYGQVMYMYYTCTMSMYGTFVVFVSSKAKALHETNSSSIGEQYMHRENFRQVVFPGGTFKLSSSKTPHHQDTSSSSGLGSLSLGLGSLSSQQDI